MRFIKARFPADKTDAVIDIINQSEPIDWAIDSGYGRAEKAVEILVAKGQGQTLLDNLQGLLGSHPDWRVTILPAEATLPRVEEKTADKEALETDSTDSTVSSDPNNNPDKTKEKAQTLALREELYQKVSNDCTLNMDFIILTVLSAIVAAIGLNGDSVAIVIAAMVIAPLLGPILAFALSAALGDVTLMWKATKTSVAGLVIGFVFALGLSQFIPINLSSVEMVSRTVITPEIIALALASGAAAALSLSTGISSALVGVMVAVALLPPSVAAALFLGAGDVQSAIGAALLLALNVVCAVLSAQLIFVYKGIRPRTWVSQKKAARSVKINAVVWLSLLLALAALAYSLNPVLI